MNCQCWTWSMIEINQVSNICVLFICLFLPPCVHTSCWLHKISPDYRSTWTPGSAPGESGTRRSTPSSSPSSPGLTTSSQFVIFISQLSLQLTSSNHLHHPKYVGFFLKTQLELHRFQVF